MFAEFDKVVKCLALELPESVHADVVAKYGKLKAEVEKFTSTNSARDEICPNCHSERVVHDLRTTNMSCLNCSYRYIGQLSPVA